MGLLLDAYPNGRYIICHNKIEKVLVLYELQQQGYTWYSGKKPLWGIHNIQIHNIIILVLDGKMISWTDNSELKLIEPRPKLTLEELRKERKQ